MQICPVCEKQMKSGLAWHMKTHSKSTEPPSDTKAPEESAPVSESATTETAPATTEKSTSILGVFTSKGMSQTIPPRPKPEKTDLDDIRAGFSEKELAKMYETLMEALSDWDGAGPEGHLTPLQSKMIAEVTYEPVCKAILSIFGDVQKFRMTIAVGMLLMGPGRAHFKAIGKKMSEAKNKKALPPAPKPQPKPEPKPEAPASNGEVFDPAWAAQIRNAEKEG